MQAIALAARQLAHPLLLVAALEVERRDVGAGLDSAAAEIERIRAARDLLPHRLLRLERLAALVNVGERHRVAHAQGAAVWLLLPRDHPEQRRLAGPVRTDHPDDAATWQLERQVVDEDPIAAPLLHVIGFDDDVAEPRPRRNGDLELRRPLLERL